MKKLLFNTLLKQIKELEKTAKNTILALLNEIPNKTYQTDKTDEERIIITYDNEKFAFVGCYIDETKGFKIKSHNFSHEKVNLYY